MPRKKKEEETVEETPVVDSPTPTVGVPQEPEYDAVDGIEVGDPMDLRPKSLPLVIKTPKGGWKNEEQETYSRMLNAYAYQNPEKWKIKKDALVKKLAELGTDPTKFILFTGEPIENNPGTPSLEIGSKNKLGN